MDTNYNINKIQEELNILFKRLLNNYQVAELRELLGDILSERDSKLINSTLKTYPKNTLKLIVERNILLSMEDKAQEISKTYLGVLKNSESKLNINILYHYFDAYISDMKRNKFSYSGKTIDELNNIYNEEISDSLKLFDDDIMNNLSSIKLDHMENLNANGRTVSINNNGNLSKKGGIFLDKNSKVGYGQFVNKNEIISIIDKMKKLPNQSISKDIDVKELKVIIDSLSQTLKIDRNEKIKNQDARVISINNTDKKAGNIFLGNKGIDLPNGEYVSVEEMTLAVNKFINDKKNRVINKPTKVMKIKNKLKHAAVVATFALSVLVSTLATNKKVYAEPVARQVITQEVMSSKENTIYQRDISDVSLDTYSDINENAVNVIQTETIDKQMNNIIDQEPITEEVTTIDQSNEIQPIIDEQALNKVEESIIDESNVVEDTDSIVENQSDMTEIKEEILNQTEVSTESVEEISVPEVETIVQNDEIQGPNVDDISQNEVEQDKEVIDDVTEEVVEEPMQEEIETIDNQISNNVEQPIAEEVPSEEVNMEEAIAEVEQIISTEEETINNTTETVSDFNGNDVVNYALQFVGNPYVYGGTSLTDGTDCSGFTSGVYSNFGISLPRTSGEQRNSGDNIGTNIEDALPGDIVCFDGHVGIYIGNGQMVHAANPRKGIVINDVNYDKPVKAIVRPHTLEIEQPSEQVEEDYSKSM